MRIVLKKIKKLLISSLDFLLLPNVKIKEKTLLIIRVDLIGDYILFRNFIELILKSEKFKDYKISLCCNILWKEIAEILDKEFIEEFIEIDNSKNIKKNLIYRYKLLRKIANKGFETCLNPAFTKAVGYTDEIVMASHALIKISFEPSCLYNSEVRKQEAQKIYSRIIYGSPNIIFEFYRNKEFIEKLIGQNFDIQKPTIDILKLKSEIGLNGEYCVIVPGATVNNRRWSLDNFKIVAEHLITFNKYKIAFLGSPLEQKLADDINLWNKTECLNLIGKTNLIEYFYLISKATLVISNESSAVHISVACNVPVVCLSNGNHFGRFNPYPISISTTCITVYPEHFASIDQKVLSEKYSENSNENINAIKYNVVLEKIDFLLNKK